MTVSNNLKIRGASWKKYDTARLQISVGQPYHEGTDFAKTVEWVAANFKRTIVCVNDTLQRYNGPGAGEAGKNWIERNNNEIRKLPDVEIIRWDYWLDHADFPALHAEVKNKYERDLIFRKAIDEECISFVTRQKSAGMGAALERSKAYLLEECAVFQIMFRTPAADIYPGSTLIPCQIFKGEAGKGFTRVEPSRFSEKRQFS